MDLLRFPRLCKIYYIAQLFLGVNGVLCPVWTDIYLNLAEF